MQDCPSSCGGCQSTTSLPHGSDFVDCGNCLDHNSVLRYENEKMMFYDFYAVFDAH